MSVIGHETEGRSTELEDLPEFELAYLFDDEENPKRVTIFQPGTGDNAASRWISIDSEHAVPIEEVQ